MGKSTGEALSVKSCEDASHTSVKTDEGTVFITGFLYLFFNPTLFVFLLFLSCLEGGTWMVLKEKLSLESTRLLREFIA